MNKTTVLAKDLSIDDHFNMAGQLYRVCYLSVGAYYTEMEAYLVDDKSKTIDLSTENEAIFVIYNQ